MVLTICPSIHVTLWYHIISTQRGCFHQMVVQGLNFLVQLLEGYHTQQNNFQQLPPFWRVEKTIHFQCVRGRMRCTHEDTCGTDA